MKKAVSVLLTWDIDPTLETAVEYKKEALRQTREFLTDLQIESTFFLPAKLAAQFDAEIHGLIEDGHEIGCHGLTHGNEEDYNRMPEDMQRAYLSEATDILRRCTGQGVANFRGPRLKTSTTTQRILAELGYVADCSVASQRIDFVSSNLINVGWVFAPRLPYRPSRCSPFRRGSQNIWVIPLSALVLPFISSALYIMRTNVMKCLFRTLYLESRHTGKPIVYLVHPFEFAPGAGICKRENLPMMQRIRTHGLLVRERFYEKDHREKFRMNQELISYMKSFPHVQFRTVRDYVSEALARSSDGRADDRGTPSHKELA